MCKANIHNIFEEPAHNDDNFGKQVNIHFLQIIIKSCFLLQFPHSIWYEFGNFGNVTTAHKKNYKKLILTANIKLASFTRNTHLHNFSIYHEFGKES